MKRMIALTLTAVFLVAFAACSNEKGQDYLNAKVLEVMDAEIMVQCIDESSDQLTGTMLAVSKNVISADGIPEMETGDEIRVVFDFGKVNKLGDPVKIEQVYAIYLLDENGNVIVN